MATDDIDQLRAELRRLYLAAPRGRWDAPMRAVGPTVLLATTGTGNQVLATFDQNAGPQLGHQCAQLAAAAVNALPALFAEIDRLRAARGIPILGDIVDGGRVIWRKPRAA